MKGSKQLVQRGGKRRVSAHTWWHLKVVGTRGQEKDRYRAVKDGERQRRRGGREEVLLTIFVAGLDDLSHAPYLPYVEGNNNVANAELRAQRAAAFNHLGASWRERHGGCRGMSGGRRCISFTSHGFACSARAHTTK